METKGVFTAPDVGIQSVSLSFRLQKIVLGQRKSPVDFWPTEEYLKFMFKSDPIIADRASQQKSYLKLHIDIAKKYGTPENHFSHKKVGFIRDSFFNFKLDKNKTIKRAEKIMYRTHDKRKHSISWYLHLTTFLRNCTKEDWIDINRLVT